MIKSSYSYVSVPIEPPASLAIAVHAAHHRVQPLE